MPPGLLGVHKAIIALDVRRGLCVYREAVLVVLGVSDAHSFGLWVGELLLNELVRLHSHLLCPATGVHVVADQFVLL